MADLSESDRAAIHAAIMRQISAASESSDATKAEWRQLINAADDFIDTNAAAYNTSIPVGIRSKFTAAQKALAFMLVAGKRYLTGA